ncbi:MAG: GFA family protein [Alphaproteobacteria bacterium]|nr:GFA family protein [Alphaproteobacteria bacterium]
MVCQNDKHEGGCFCGAVRYRIDGAVESVTHCHCNSCRRSSGAAFVTWFTVGRERFAWIAGRPSQFVSSPGVTREFCGTCGTELTYASERAAKTIDITIGSLDCAAGHPADRHIWTADKLDWLHLDGQLPAYREWSKEE